jgi:hypothetical protein
MNTPPRSFGHIDVPLIHKACEFYKKVYLLSFRIPKRDRLGILAKIEDALMEIIKLSITASLAVKTNKFLYLDPIRIKIEVLKNFFRIAYELDIIRQKTYIDMELDLQELSKMTSGWIKYLR